MARATMIPTLLVLLLVVCCATTVVQGKEWVVGDNKGWSFGVSGWESGKDIQSGDVLGENSKDQVGEGDYNSCRVSGPSRTYTSGNDHIQLARGGKAFFICSLPGHCQQGMKIAVTS
ncbi:hypothetical protein CFC21_080345 [Triticum aestivum]|uniref:Phytocyanin domain-containing protein n=2 Tax=Triticum aestivum TaxID=4565 RepID=A0A9R1L2T3_WHEAT|nr:chemocyanin-like [Triticum aestivum]KAF7075581.1 hypothetical protein CFC21_080345 [Triticum aestivum]